MTPSVVWLGWACYAGSALAIIVYLRHLLGPERGRRPWSAAGLLFTSLALGQTPFLFEDAFDRVRIARACIVTLCLLMAVGLQAFALLRPERLGGGPAAARPASPDASPAEPPNQGPDA